MVGHTHAGNRSPDSGESGFANPSRRLNNRNSFIEAFSHPIPFSYLPFLPLDKDILALAHTHDFAAGMGNFSLTLYGFVELISRVACFGSKLGDNPVKSLDSLLRIMNATDATSKIFEGANRHSTRKSIPVRKFNVHAERGKLF